MDEAVIGGSGPIEVDLEEGKTYFFCTCGRSGKQPFCDGSHKDADTDLKSHPFTAERSGKAWLCACKRTGNAPYCDGTHDTISG